YWEGSGSSTTYPFERWFYRSLRVTGPSGATVRSGVEIEFVDPTGTGEYRIARNPFEKEVGGFGNGPSPEDINMLGVRDYKRVQDSPFEVLGLLKDLEAPAPPPANANSDGIWKTPSPIEDSNLLDVEIKTHFFRQSDGSVITAFAIQTSDKDLVFRDSGGLA